MVEARDFIRVWQESSSLAEVAAKTRSKKNACRVRGQRYKDMGVPLKDFAVVQYVTSEEWWEDLRQYAESLLPEDGDDGADEGETVADASDPGTAAKPHTAGAG